MAKKTDDRTLNISVIGLSGTEREKGAAGIGKSCLCNRFICQVADKYSQDHISVLSQSDFVGRVINNDHFLYWGEVTKTDDGNNFTFHVIEQTEFIDDVSFQPFKTGRTDPYLKRCALTKVQSAEKLMYICKDQLGMETDSSYEQKIIPDGKLNIDGFICCFDVSPVQQRTLESQVDFVVHLLNSAIKSKKPVVLVTTKNDEASDRYLKEAEKIVARKEYENNIPLIGTSAHENVNVELAFMTLAHLIDKNKTRPKIIPFSDAVKQRNEILDVATEAYRMLLRGQVTDSKATWASSRRKLEKESDFGHYLDLFGTDLAKRLFKRHITNLREEQIKKREVSFIKKLPDALHHFLPDLITINDRPWSGCQQIISNHPDFDDYFVEVPGVDSWKFEQEFVDNYAETRIPFDLLNSSDAENCFRNHLNALQAEFRKSQLKEKFKRALEDNPQVIPGKDLKETAIFFIGKECYNDLNEEERHQVYEHHQQELKQQAKLEFQELLCEKLDLFVRMIGTTERITPEDIRFITKELEEDYRYRKLDRIEEERKIILLNHLGFMECPSKERCHFREKCAENKVQLLLASRPVRPEPQKNVQPTECSPLNLVLLGKLGLATTLMKEIRLVCNDDEFHCYGKLYSLDYRTIENDVSVEFNTLAIFKPDICICVYNSRESLDYLKVSLAATNEDKSSLADLPMVIVQAYNKDLSEKEQVILHSRGQKIARQYDCPFIDIPFEHDEQDPFCRQQITRVLDSIGLELSNDGRPLSEIMEPDLRVGMCLMCGDAYPAEIPMGPLLNSNPTQVRADLNPSINIEINLESTPDLNKQKIEICCGSYHKFVSKIQKEDEDDDVFHGFILVFSPKRKASFYTMKAFAETLRRYWSTMPILILAITDKGASTIFFQDELSQSLMQKANEIADELGIEYMTTSAHFQNQALVFNNFFKETWHKRDEINESYYCEASCPPAYDETMAQRPPAPLPKTYDTYTKSSTSNSQSTEDSDPLYDQPQRYRHNSDSEPERPSSTSPPPFRADPSGEYAQNGEHLVRPSVIKRLNKNAGEQILEDERGNVDYCQELTTVRKNDEKRNKDDDDDDIKGSAVHPTGANEIQSTEGTLPYSAEENAAYMDPQAASANVKQIYGSVVEHLPRRARSKSLPDVYLSHRKSTERDWFYKLKLFCDNKYDVHVINSHGIEEWYPGLEKFVDKKEHIEMVENPTANKDITEAFEALYKEKMGWTTSKDDYVRSNFDLACRFMLSKCVCPNTMKDILIRSMEKQIACIAKAASWCLIKNLLHMHMSLPKESLTKIKDIWPGFSCHCQTETKGHSKICSTEAVIIIELNEHIKDLKTDFMGIQIIQSCSDHSKDTVKTSKNPICKPIENTTQPAYSNLSGEIVELYFKKHSKLTIIYISSDIPDCVQLYCQIKGVIPMGEDHFPKQICEFATNVTEGHVKFMAKIKVGDRIGTTQSAGTLGGFVQWHGFDAFLTCAHVVYDKDLLLAKSNRKLHKGKVEVYCHHNIGGNWKDKCGHVMDHVFEYGNSSQTSMDVALVLMNKNAVQEEYAFLGKQQKYINDNYISLSQMPVPITLKARSVGMVSGYFDASLKLNWAPFVSADDYDENKKLLQAFQAEIAEGLASNTPPPSRVTLMHFQNYIIPKLFENSTREVVRFYHQISVEDLPFKEGDSGTCVYIVDDQSSGSFRLPTGCIGMAIGSYLDNRDNKIKCIVTPIDKIMDRLGLQQDK